MSMTADARLDRLERALFRGLGIDLARYGPQTGTPEAPAAEPAAEAASPASEPDPEAEAAPAKPAAKKKK